MGKINCNLLSPVVAIILNVFIFSSGIEKGKEHKFSVIYLLTILKHGKKLLMLKVK